MSQHIPYNFSCRACGENFLPLRESGWKCPKCNAPVSEDEKPPTITEIVGAATHNLGWWAFSISNLGDAVVQDANTTIRRILADNIPDNEEAINEFVEGCLADMDLSGCPHLRDHLKIFLKLVTVEFIRNKRKEAEKLIQSAASSPSI